MAKMVYMGPGDVIPCICGNGGDSAYFSYYRDDYEEEFANPWFFVKCPNCGRRHSLDVLREDFSQEEKDFAEKKNMEWLKGLRNEDEGIIGK